MSYSSYERFYELLSCGDLGHLQNLDLASGHRSRQCLEEPGKKHEKLIFVPLHLTINQLKKLSYLVIIILFHFFN